ncbi:unnamed protein product [Rotaria sp. Silwood1]|nr:unnamed protein product [Rotaria sp. Silwood1]CAF1652870.1 unnamed protein product [Rotaria sp. Silwood1]CAF3786544.1 unnamed protein product [Rotaria sp. Silwood1]CAF3900900.1 unnamed protein product [Rotaria sp. Silwood1]CAF3910299.1 unnamed protein product [Rotaria sp. Silwood1]
MTVLSFEIETDSNDEITELIGNVTTDNLRSGLEKCTGLRSWTPDYAPILKVITGPLSINETEEKIHWLNAEIHRRHLGKGQTTQQNKDLATKIRSRGKPGDDCGHIIAASLGGKMVDFNLFPQTRFINRGQYGWASVEFEVRLFYDDMEYKDRPSGGKILITFKGDRMKKSGIHNSNQNEQSSSSLYATLKGKLINLIKDES